MSSAMLENTGTVVLGALLDDIAIFIEDGSVAVTGTDP